MKLPDLVVSAKKAGMKHPILEAHLKLGLSADDGHGEEHIRIVAGLTKNALFQYPLTERERALGVIAALLHESDDEKFSAKKQFDAQESLSFPNARQILRAQGFSPEDEDRVIEIISYVGASTNGDSIPDGMSPADHWKLSVRYADRLEATGWTGIARCMSYSKFAGQPLEDEPMRKKISREYLESPECADLWRRYSLPKSDPEALKIKTAVGHLCQKIVHIGRPELQVAGWIGQELARGRETVISYLLEYATTGQLPSYEKEYEIEHTQHLSYLF